jgi:hypothetical protein
MTVAPTHLRRPSRSTTILLGAIAALLAAILVVLLVGRRDSDSSTTVGSGVTSSETRTVPPFDGVELAGGNIVRVVAGPKQAVVVHADSNLLDRVTTQVQGGRLVIGQVGSFTTHSPMSVDVTVPSLSVVTLSGSGIVTASGIDAKRLTLALPGSGVPRASGRVERLDATLDGSGDAQLQSLTAREAHASVGGSGRILVNATDSLDAHVSGSGAILYTGNPAQVTRDVSGSGAIIGG